MSGEIGINNPSDVKMPSVENVKEINASDKKAFKEAESFWEKEFQDQAEQAKVEPHNNTDLSSKIDTQDVQSKDIVQIVKDYIQDLKSKSDYPDTISDDAIDTSDLEVQPPDKVADKREEFVDKKDQLRKEWEELNHQEWPKYKEDVVNADGKVIRKAGDNYDAHHIKPLHLGGDNTASNITPLDVKSHKEIHSSSGSCNALVESVKGGN